MYRKTILIFFWTLYAVERGCLRFHRQSPTGRRVFVWDTCQSFAGLLILIHNFVFQPILMCLWKKSLKMFFTAAALHINGSHCWIFVSLMNFFSLGFLSTYGVHTIFSWYTKSHFPSFKKVNITQESFFANYTAHASLPLSIFKSASCFQFVILIRYQVFAIFWR